MPKTDLRRRKVQQTANKQSTQHLRNMCAKYFTSGNSALTRTRQIHRNFFSNYIYIFTLLIYQKFIKKINYFITSTLQKSHLKTVNKLKEIESRRSPVEHDVLSQISNTRIELTNVNINYQIVAVNNIFQRFIVMRKQVA